MDSLRAMVRDVLAEELGTMRRAGMIAAAGNSPRREVREEMVSIRSDAELAAFVARLVEILKDGRSREEIEQGRWVFRLGDPGTGRFLPGSPEQRGAPVSSAAPAASVARFERGVVSERQIEGLPTGTTCVVVGKSVRLTPLARDRLRVLGIALKRTEA
jgi:hypothetical protein